MKRLALLVLIGCGPGVDFPGTYEGPLTLAGPCASMPAQSYAGTVKLVQYTTTLRVEPGFMTCDFVELSTSGSTATIKPITCPAKTGSWGKSDLSGTLVATGQNLELHVKIQFDSAGLSPAETACNALTLTGAAKKL